LGSNFLRNLISNYDCTVKAVVDPSKERQEFVKKTYSEIYVTDELDSVINDPDIDAVVIATSVASQYDLTIQALNMGNMCSWKSLWQRRQARYEKSGN